MEKYWAWQFIIAYKIIHISFELIYFIFFSNLKKIKKSFRRCGALF